MEYHGPSGPVTVQAEQDQGSSHAQPDLDHSGRHAEAYAKQDGQKR